MCLSVLLGLAGCGGNESNLPHPVSRSPALLLVLLLRLRSGTHHALRKQIVQSGVTLTCLWREDTPSHLQQSAIHSRPDAPGLHYCHIHGSVPKHRFHMCKLPSPLQRSFLQLQLQYSTTHEFQGSSRMLIFIKLVYLSSVILVKWQ